MTTGLFFFSYIFVFLYHGYDYMSNTKGMDCLPFASTCVHSVLVRSVLLIILCFMCCAVFFLSFVCHRLILPVSLDCPLLIALSVFSVVYLIFCTLKNYIIILVLNRLFVILFWRMLIIFL